MKDIRQKIIGKTINISNELILLKLSKTDWKPNNKIPINMLGGPIKITFTFCKLSPNGNITKIEDNRDLRFLYYTIDYYNKYGIKNDDLLKVADMCFNDKLEKRLLAPKLITQIK